MDDLYELACEAAQADDLEEALAHNLSDSAKLWVKSHTHTHTQVEEKKNGVVDGI